MSEKTVFTRIIDRELPAEILFENEHIIVIKDIHPDAPIHWLGITKHPYTSLDALLSDGDNRDLLWELLNTLANLAHEHGLKERGYRIVSNIGLDAHQIVPHMHIHLLGGERLQMKDPHPKEA